MKNIFSLQRFWILVRKHANENWKIFLLFFIIINVPVILLYFVFIKPQPEVLYGIYIIFLVLFGGIYTSLFFKDWTRSARSTSMLTLPVSEFEKIALVLFYSVFIFIPVFTVAYYYSCLILSNIYYPGMPLFYSQYYDEHFHFLVFAAYVLLPYTFCHSIFLLSSVWLKKFQFLIALAGIVILIFAFFLWNSYYFQQMMEGSKHARLNPLYLFPTEVEYMDTNDSWFITSPVLTNISIMLYVMITAFLYIASYFKLKEKQI